MSFVSNIVGFCRKSNLAKLSKSDSVNMFVHTSDSNDDSFRTIMRPFPGYKSVLTISNAANPQGLFKVSRGPSNTPAMYGIWSGDVYLIEESQSGSLMAHLIGHVNSNTNKCTFAETSGYGTNHPHLVICDGTALYCVDTTLAWGEQATYFSKHSPIQMPYCYPNSTTTRITPSWVAYMYGYLIVGAEGTDIFYTSYQYPFEKEDETARYDIFQLSSTNGYGKWTMSEWQPDNTVVGCSNGSRLFTLGTSSYQVFTYQNSRNSPFTSPDTASKKIGIRSKNSLAQYGDNIFWLGSADQGSNIIYMMDGSGVPQRISTDSIEEMISTYDSSNVNSHVIRWRSHVFYILTFISECKTIAYDLKEGDWVRLASVNQNQDEILYRYKNSVVSPKGKVLVQAANCLCEMTESKWNEHDSAPILRKRVGGIISSNYQPFKIASLELFTNNGDYDLITSPAQIKMRFSRDGKTWESITFESMGYDGEYDYQPKFKHLGKAKYLSVELSTTDNIPFALYGMDVKGVSTTR